MSKFSDFTAAAPNATDQAVGYDADGGSGSDRRWPISAISPVKYSFNASDTENSLAHLAGVAVGDTFSVRWFDGSKQQASHARWYCYAVSGTTTPGTIGNGGASYGITMEGTDGARFLLVPEYGNVVDIRACGITCDGVTSGFQSRLATLAAAAKARGLKLVNSRLQPLRITSTVDLDNFDCDLHFQAGTLAERTIASISKANPGVVTIAAHGFTNGQVVKIYNATGMTEVNGNTYTVANATTNTFELSGTDTSGFGTYTASSGKLQVVGNGDFMPDTGTNILVTGITNANPGVVTTDSAHGLSAGDTFMFGVSGLGILPPNVSPLVTYYVLASGLTSTTFTFSTSSGGTAVNTTAASTQSPGTGTYYVFKAPSAVAGMQTKDIVEWDGTVRRLAIAVRGAFSPGVSNGQRQQITVKGDGGYDFTTKSTVLGILGHTDDSPHGDITFKASYCYIGSGIAGPFEKKVTHHHHTYCNHAVFNLNGSSADTIKIVICATKCQAWYTEADSVSTSLNIEEYCEGRTDPGTGAPANFIRNGKYTSLAGLNRGHEGSDNILVFKSKLYGTDTFELKNFHVIHGYGRQINILACRHVHGSYHLHDILPGPNAGGGAIEAAVKIGRVMIAGGLRGTIQDCTTSVGLQIGETSGYYSREANFGTHAIQMGTNINVLDSNTDNGSTGFPTGLVALDLQAAKGGGIRLTQCIGDVQRGAGIVASNGVAFDLQLPQSAVRYTLPAREEGVFHVGFGALVDFVTGKLPTSLIPDLSGVTSFQEAVRDIMGTALVAGTNMTINPDDSGDTITLNASGGGGSFDGNLTEYTTTSPDAPTSGVTIFARSRVGQRRLGYRGPTNRPRSVQTMLGTNRTRQFVPSGNGATAASPGFIPSTAGTATARTVANTDNYTMMTRLGYVAASAAANQGFGWRSSGLQFARSNAGADKRNSGFEFIARYGWAVADGNLGRLFVGMSGSGSAISASTDPVNAVNCIFIGADDGDANLSIFCNDGSGTCTKTSLGASFPAKTASADAYEVRIACAPDGDRFYWSCENLFTGAYTDGNLTTDIPAGTTLLAPQMMGSTGSSTTALGIDIMSLYIETDY